MAIESGPPVIDMATIWSLAVQTGVTLCGAFMRAANWHNDKGEIVWSRVLVEIPVAIATATVAGGFADYMKWDIKITYGICGLLGLLGPAFFTGLGATILSVIRSRFGRSNGDKSHGSNDDDNK